MESNFVQATHEINGRSDARYFGKDLTNLESQAYPSKDVMPHNRSSLNNSNRDAKPKCLGKPTPFQFYKGIFENQRLMHKRSATNEVNKSGSIDMKENTVLYRVKTDANEPERNEIPKPEIDKRQLSKFLKSKSTLGDGQQRDEKRSQNQIEIRDFNNSQNCFDLRNHGVNQEIPPGTFTNKFSSIPMMLGTIKSNQIRPSSISVGIRQSPQGSLLPSQATGHHPEYEQIGNPAPKKIIALNKIHNLKSKVDAVKEPSANIPAKRNPLSPTHLEDRVSMQNELDLLSSQTNYKSRLFQAFDIPFMWNFLLSQNVFFA